MDVVLIIASRTCTPNALRMTREGDTRCIEIRFPLTCTIRYARTSVMRRHCIRLRLLYSLTHSLHVLVKVAYCHNKELRRLAKLHALSWFHGLAGLQQLGGLPLVKPTMEGLKRMLAKPKVQKEPVMANILKAMVEATGPEPPLSDVRLLGLVGGICWFSALQ